MRFEKCLHFSFTRSAFVAGAVLALSGCGSMSGEYPRNGPLIPPVSLRLTESTVVPLENIVTYAGIAVVLYLIVDPLAPNWRIEEARLEPLLCGRY